MPHLSLSWLARHVELPADVTIEQVADDLVRVGFEEEKIQEAAVTGPLVAGRVLSYEVEEHSNGKSVRYCRVDVGEHNDEPGQGAETADVASRGIVCGAHNFEVGDTVVVSLPGTVLPGPFPIASRKTYGHVSDGMIVSERELGLGEDHDGIIVLDPEVFGDLPEPGAEMITALGLGEKVLEVNVTPDRGYAFAVRGLAREYALATGAEFTDPGLLEAVPDGLLAESSAGFSVRVDPEAAEEGRPACSRFVTRVVRGIDPAAQTPAWMKTLLEQAGMRPISLPVDVTNFVMLDLGQPLHAYDLRAVAEPFVVRRAERGEVFETLDGQSHVLEADELVITDSPQGQEGSRIVGLAGVMGGLNSEVQNDTTDVVIEAANFDPVLIARSARRHRLHSEASKRFERGVDPQLPAVAAARAAELLAEYGGGTVDPAGFDFDVVQPLPAVSMPVGEPRRLIGVDYSPERIGELLESIGCTVRFEDDEVVAVPPSWRPDLVGPAHLVEEIARLDGFDRIPSRLPISTGSTGLSALQKVRRRTSATLAVEGLVEVKSYPFVGAAHDRMGLPEHDERRNALRLRNPLADDAPWLRTSLLDSLLGVAERNASRGLSPVALFELGQVATPEGTTPAELIGVERAPSPEELATLQAGVPKQPMKVAGVIGGPFAPRGAQQLLEGAEAPLGWGWADAIGLARSVGSANGVRIETSRTWVPPETPKLRGAPVPESVADPQDTAPFHPGRCATLFVRSGRSFEVVGYAGELHPRVVKEFGLPKGSSAFELDLKLVAELVKAQPVQVKPVSTYPPVKEDLAIVVQDHVPAANVEMVLKRAAGPLLESAQLFDVYQGEQVPLGHKSLAYALVFRSSEKTLGTEDVQELRQKIIASLAKTLDAAIRGD